MKIIIEKLKYFFSKNNMTKIKDDLSNRMDEFIDNHKVGIIATFFALGALISAGMMESIIRGYKSDYRANMQALGDSIEVSRIDKNRILSENKVLQLSVKDLKSLSKTKDKEIAKLIEDVRLLKKKDSGTNAVININTNTGSTIVNESADSIKCDRDTTINFNDSTLNADIKIEAKNGYVKIPKIDYTVNVPITVSLTDEGKVSVVSNDNVKITSLKAWIAEDFNNKPKKKWFGVGIQSGYGLTPGGYGPYFGIGISVNLINF